jgi:Ca-activated chloride channel homolog
LLLIGGLKSSSYNPAKVDMHSNLKPLAVDGAKRTWPRELIVKLGVQRKLTVLVLLPFIVASLAFAQEPTAPAKRPRKVFQSEIQKPDDVVRVDTDLVSVDVVVRDSEGRPVRDLQRENFKIYSDGVEQPLSFFHVESRNGQPRPLALVFAIDISGSMTNDEMDRLNRALQLFSTKLSDHQVVFSVVAFGMNVKVLQRFTSDPQKLDRAFERIGREPNGLSTHTYDAVDDAIRMLVRQAPRTRERRLIKRAVLVITDGFPVGDTVSARTVIERANAAETSVYVVTLPSFSRMMASTSSALPTPLDVSGLAELTGGKSVYAYEENYGPLFASLAEEVTSAYVLAFYPPEEKRKDGEFHAIRVEGPKGLVLQQSRPGFQSATK